VEVALVAVAVVPDVQLVVVCKAAESSFIVIVRDVDLSADLLAIPSPGGNPFPPYL
jgi:hypothetical protein